MNADPRRCACGCERPMEGRPRNAIYARPDCASRARRAQGVEDDQWLYRAYDETGELLYIGVTKRFVRRFDDHGRESTWWREVASLKIEHFPDRVAVERAELKAIREEKPRHNIANNRARYEGLEGPDDFWIDYEDALRCLTEDLAPFVEPQRVEAALREALPERELARLTEGDGS